MYLKFRNFMNQFAIKLLIYISSFLFLTVSMMSFLTTAVFEKNKVETITYVSENIILLLFLSIGFVLFLYMTYCWVHWSDELIKKLRILMVGYVILLGIIWMYVTQSLPFADGLLVDQATAQFQTGNFSQLDQGQYFHKFPFQLNLVFVFDLIYKIFGYHNYLALQILNVISLAATYYYICKTMEILFEKKEYQGMLIIWLMLCIPAILYCSFIYSTMYGFFFSTIAFYYGLVYVKNKKIIYFAIIIPAFSIAIMLKSNFLITLLAFICILIMDFINQKKLISLILILLLLICQGVPAKLIHGYYENISGQDIGKGIPTVAWIAMGMHEGNKAPGWYNSFMFDAYKKANYDTKKTSELSITGINERIDYFKKNPYELVLFYGGKMNSQWNEPTYESLWVSEHRKGMHAIPLSSAVKSLYFGKLNKIYLNYSNVYQFLIFVFATYGILTNRKKYNYMQLSVVIIIIGGFLFHMIWEGNSKYILPYFVLVIFYTAIGSCNMFKKINEMRRK